MAVGFPLVISSAPEAPPVSKTQVNTVGSRTSTAQSVKTTQAATPAAVQRQPVRSETRLDSYLDNVKQGYNILGEQVKIGDQQVMEESRIQLEQAKAQKKDAEQALSAVKEDKRRLEAERDRLDASLMDANRLYVQLAEQSKQQLANLKIQEKKADEALAFVIAKRTQLEADKAAFNVASKSANPTYLDDVQRTFAERENQVKETYSLLEAESKNQLAKIRAREAAAEKALDKIVQEKEKIELEKKQLGASLEDVNKRYELLIKQAELQLALVQAEEKVSEETLSAILHPQEAKAALQSPQSNAAPPKPAAAAPAAPKPAEKPVSYTLPTREPGFPLDSSMF